jgi:hypothetical protein
VVVHSHFSSMNHREMPRTTDFNWDSLDEFPDVDLRRSNYPLPEDEVHAAN